MKDRFIFYSRSADKAPGKGKGESVVNESIYKELSKIANWRKILGNFHECNFVYEGRTYKTVEHASKQRNFSP